METDAVGLRVLGCLIEKQRTTPDVYPLSINALRAACNQTTNRDPVVSYDVATIRTSIDRLSRLGWVRLASGAGSRAAKYVFNVEAAAPTPELYEGDHAWVRRLWDAMRPHASGAGGYVNFMVEADPDRVKASYGEAKYARLARIKAELDPQNFFHLNANIKPAQP